MPNEYGLKDIPEDYELMRGDRVYVHPLDVFGRIEEDVIKEGKLVYLIQCEFPMSTYKEYYQRDELSLPN